MITEFMANPDGVGDSVGEWIELRADADIAFTDTGFIDLNDLEVGKRSDSGSTGATVLTAPECMPISAGEYAVFTRTAEPAQNGCIANPAGVVGFGLNNSANTIYIRTAESELDAVYYAGTTPGVSSSRDEVTGAWCSVAGEVYDTCLSGANSGTPGAENTDCPP
jgi:hypothetical protein